MNRFRFVAAVAGLALATAVSISAQQPTGRALSAVGTASTEVGGKWVKTEKTSNYEGGKWIDITYGRPRLRYRTNIFGSGADYGKAILAGAPIWRAGANVSTRLKTESALMINGKHVMPGEYSIFIEAKEGAWTFVLSSWAAQQKFDKADKTALWGAYGYTADKDVVRAPMALSALPNTVEELTWNFVDMNDKGGKLAIMWEKTMATVAFTTM
jgi:Protein of unknown function (DUF2911)